MRGARFPCRETIVITVIDFAEEGTKNTDRNGMQKLFGSPETMICMRSCYAQVIRTYGKMFYKINVYGQRWRASTGNSSNTFSRKSLTRTARITF